MKLNTEQSDMLKAFIRKHKEDIEGYGGYRHEDFKELLPLLPLINSKGSITTEIKELLKWNPEMVDLKTISKIHYPEKYFPKKQFGDICTDEDVKAPFFSESYLYNLLGKEDARTLIALTRKAFLSLGVKIDI